MEATLKVNRKEAADLSEEEIGARIVSMLDRIRFSNDLHSMKALEDLNHPAAVSMLAKVALDPHERSDLRILTSGRLAAIGGEEAVDALVSVLWRAEDRSDVRCHAAAMLGELSGKKVLDALEWATKCVDAQVVKSAIQALQRNQARQALGSVPALMNGLEQAAESSIRWGQFLAVFLIGSALLIAVYISLQNLG